MAPLESQVRESITDFVVTNFLFGQEECAPAGGDSLVMGKRIIDSTGVLELIEFLETEFQIEVTEAETIPENLDSIDCLTAFVMAKTRPSRGARQPFRPPTRPRAVVDKIAV